MDDVCDSYDALIRFFYKENPDLLDDVEWARRVRDLRWLGEEGFLRGGK